jgi:hypothetical protein
MRGCGRAVIRQRSRGPLFLEVPRWQQVRWCGYAELATDQAGPGEGRARHARAGCPRPEAGNWDSRQGETAVRERAPRERGRRVWAGHAGPTAGAGKDRNVQQRGGGMQCLGYVEAPSSRVVRANTHGWPPTQARPGVATNTSYHLENARARHTVHCPLLASVASRQRAISACRIRGCRSGGGSR